MRYGNTAKTIHKVPSEANPTYGLPAKMILLKMMAGLTVGTGVGETEPKATALIVPTGVCVTFVLFTEKTG